MLDLDKRHYFAQMVVSVSVVLAFFGVLGALIATLFHKTDDLAAGVREVLLILTGVLAGAFKEVTGFWLGSSSGSVRKTITENPGQ